MAAAPRCWSRGCATVLCLPLALRGRGGWPGSLGGAWTPCCRRCSTCSGRSRLPAGDLALDRADQRGAAARPADGRPRTAWLLPILILGLVYRALRGAAGPGGGGRAARRPSSCEAARATGGGRWHILRRHMLPQVWRRCWPGCAPVVAAMTLLTEAALSVLGHRRAAAGRQLGHADRRRAGPDLHPAAGGDRAGPGGGGDGAGAERARRSGCAAMAEAVLRGLLRGVLVLFGISVLVFLIFFATPGADPAARLAGRGASPETLARGAARIRARPAAAGAIRGADAAAVRHPRPAELRQPRAARGAGGAAGGAGDAGLAAGAAVLWLAAGLGIGAACGGGLGGAGGGDRGRLIVAAGLLGVSVPAFWLGEMVNAGRPKAGCMRACSPGCRRSACRGAAAGEWLRGMALPWVTLAVLYAGIYGRVLRTEPGRRVAAGLRPHGAGEGARRAAGRCCATRCRTRWCRCWRCSGSISARWWAAGRCWSRWCSACTAIGQADLRRAAEPRSGHGHGLRAVCVGAGGAGERRRRTAVQALLDPRLR